MALTPDTEAVPGTAAATVPGPQLPYDALLLYSFGGPNKPEDVVPFLRNVTAGKGIPDARLEEVGEHYYGFGGKSPINEQNLALQAALEGELAARGIDLPIVWGNRNWEPYTRDAVEQLKEMGVQRAVALVTSAYSSYSGCRQYREDLAVTLEGLGDLGPDGSRSVQFDKVRSYFNHPGFAQANVDAVVDGYRALAEKDGAELAAAARLVFVTHSIPDTMEAASAVSGATYSEQHLDLAAVVAAEVSAVLGHPVEWTLSYCSRSGPPSQTWLEPDVNDHLGELAEAGVRSVVISPIGFISDHMEVAYDLDTEAIATAAELGLAAVRAGTVSTRAPFVSGLVDLVLERAALARGDEITEQTVGALPAYRSICRPGCCRRRDGEDSGVPALCSEALNS
ncbi:ferrochelatase [Sanguibacter keddieii DSM 10542]|uniref:Coproporphyrin III ferrochelatase n=1 Tax=Sanguibacter keddieii (strain ATCC 51767 / DSM 10542 / NCFB 3025 / ST-74) TaxID=446469 RepID=D1BC05_SANKS|nr:ferrochelatase [Sanguibacter keddieii]ACZ20785.1 ferrochelatase [Sanguibacter keddieii DSM 10542]